MTDGVFEFADGSFQACVQIQDGVERSVHATLKEAVKAYRSGHRVMNGTKVKKRDVPVFRAVRVETPQYRWERVA